MRPAKPFAIATLFAAVAAALLLWSRSERSADSPTAQPIDPGKTVPSSTPSAPRPTAAPSQERPFGEQTLADYAAPSRTPEQDLEAIARTLGNLALLVKGDRPLPLGANEEIAAALRGKNKAAVRAVADDHRIFNAQGQLIDRWETPLFFHAESRDRLGIRSAGPDRKMWTPDDLHRLPDGRYLRDEALLAPSLYEDKPAAR